MLEIGTNRQSWTLLTSQFWNRDRYQKSLHQILDIGPRNNYAKPQSLIPSSFLTNLPFIPKKFMTI